MDEYKIVSIEEGLTKIEFPEYEKVSCLFLQSRYFKRNRTVK